MIACTNCGVQSPDGTKFCPNCGHDLGAQQGAAAQPPPPPAPRPPAATVPTSAAAPPPAPVPAAPATPAYAPPAPSGGGGAGMSGKIAAAVGAVVILGGVFAGVKLLTANDDKAVVAVNDDGAGTEAPEPEASPTTDTGTVTAPEEVPTPTPTPAPESGAPTDFIEDPVGTWNLADVAESPDIAQAWGATDAISALYTDANGIEVGFTIAAYTSTEDAFATVPVLANSLLAGEPAPLPVAAGPLAADLAQGGGGQNRFQVFDQGDVTDQEGNVIGQYVLLEGPVELIFWSNGPFIRAAEGRPGAAIDFYANSSF